MTALEMTWGNTYAFDVAVTAAGVAVDLATKTLRFLAKSTYGDADAAAKIAKATSSGIVHTDEDGGIARVTIAQADTASLDPTTMTVLYWDVKLIDGSNGYTVASGTLSVAPAVVRATT